MVPSDLSGPPPPVRPARSAEAAILAATERLLRERPFSELAVADIIAAAAVSRTSFYAHFASRTAVLAGCLSRVIDEIAAAVDPYELLDQDDPAAAMHTGLRRWVALAPQHGALLRPLSEEWPHDPELGSLWRAAMERFSARTAEAIRRARADGHTGTDVDPETLAALLIWGCERVLHVALVGGVPGLEDPEAIVEPLSQMLTAGMLGAR